MVNFDLNGDGNSCSDRTPGVGRNTFRLPNTYSVDPRVTKTFPIYERMKVQFLFEAFNIFNRTNISDVNRTQFSRSASAAACVLTTAPCLVPQSNFALANTSAGPRIIQLAAKIF